MKLRADRCPLTDWLIAIFGRYPSRRSETKRVKRKPHPRHRHAAFLELP
jgi:hypothetical protein